MSQDNKPASDFLRVRRNHKRAHYDRATIDRVLDAGHLAHIGFVSDERSVVIPMMHWRDGDFVYWHGSGASRAITMGPDQRACLTVTHLDGLVFAKSAFHHSANYRCAMVFGVPEQVEGNEAKTRALKVMMDRLALGRWETLRPVTDQELRATSIPRLPITEFSGIMQQPHQ